MASVFLSYDRQDTDRARVIAQALEKAGHGVWWDRHIQSGAQYSKAIEEALKRADAVVVLWSEHSVESPWVRDEAAAGRDSGRLVPVSIGSAEPPLGFRQYQTTGLARWKGSRAPAKFQEVLDAIHALSGGSKPDRIAPLSAKAPFRWRPAYSLLALGLAILIAALLVWRPWAAPRTSSVVAVVAANPSPMAQGLARDLLAKLGGLGSARAEPFNLVAGGTDAEPDLTFEVDAATNNRSETANLVLLAGKDRALLWSSSFEQPVGHQADLKQQLAYTAGKVLECAIDALSAKGERIRRQTLKLHLSGCSGLSLAHSSDPEQLLPVLRRVTEEMPQFEDAWANLLRAEIAVLQTRDMEDSGLRQLLRSDIAAARRANPALAEAFLAEAWLSPPRPIHGWMRWVEKAVAANPNHSLALQERSLGYNHVGRMKDAVRDAQKAVDFDPLSPSARSALASAYAFAGQLEAANAELTKAERLWPGATSVRSSRHRIELRYGDARKALAQLASGEVGSINLEEAQAFLEARIDPTPAMVERALNAARAFANDSSAMSILSQSLAEFGRTDELAQVLLTADPGSGAISVLFRPQFRDLHRDPRFMKIAVRLGLVEYWQQVGKWPDFCSEPDLPYDCKAEEAKLSGKSG